MWHSLPEVFNAQSIYNCIVFFFTFCNPKLLNIHLKIPIKLRGNIALKSKDNTCVVCKSRDCCDLYDVTLTYLLLWLLMLHFYCLSLSSTMCVHMFCIILLCVCIFVCILNFALDSCIFYFLRLPLCWLRFIYCHVCGDVCCSEYCMLKCTYLNKDSRSTLLL